MALRFHRVPRTKSVEPLWVHVDLQCFVSPFNLTTPEASFDHVICRWQTMTNPTRSVASRMLGRISRSNAQMHLDKSRARTQVRIIMLRISSSTTFLAFMMHELTCVTNDARSDARVAVAYIRSALSPTVLGQNDPLWKGALPSTGVSRGEQPVPVFRWSGWVGQRLEVLTGHGGHGVDAKEPPKPDIWRTDVERNERNKGHRYERSDRTLRTGRSWPYY